MHLSLKDRITKKLVESGLITQAKLKKALAYQKEKGGKLSDVLVELGFIKQEDFLSALSQDLNIPLINLAKYNADPEVINLIPIEIVKQYKLLPLSKIGSTITIAVCDPLDIFAIDDIKSLTGYEVRLMLASEDSILYAISQHYGKRTRKEIETVVQKMMEPETISPGQESKAVSNISISKELPVVKVANILLSDAVRLKASDILIEPLEDMVRIRYRIDGILQDAKNLPKEMHEAIISRVKVMSDLNIAEKRLPQDGRFKIKWQGRIIDFRVSVLPTSYGEKIALRVLDKSQVNLNIENLGFEDNILEQLKEGAKRPHGMIMVCGPTGSGKTTTLYSVLNFIDSPEKNIVTVEDPVEYDMKGINQVNVRSNIGLTFSSSLRSILRQDPDVIMIGEIRDYETLDIAVKAALTGHLVLSTIHTNSSVGAITRMINMGLEPFLITASVIVVLAQRLVRKICPECKESYLADNPTKKALGLDEKKEFTFYKGVGCKKCFGTGHKGRMGVIELLFLNSELKEMIMNQASESELFKKAKEFGLATLREDGIAKALKGITSVEEVLRVTAG
ncbi:MAG: ATPase, T2SS/T4P/T4SS family [Candidatus Omnitrophota bacterium]